MKTIVQVLIMGACLFGSHYLFAKIFYNPKNIIDLNENEVKEL